MKIKGFTLAEILITLGIIGVVAALTMPTLIQNVTNSKIGPALSKFSNVFTNAARVMMQEQSMSYLDNDVSANLILMAEYMDMVPLDKNEKYYATDGKGKNNYEIYSKIDVEDMINKVLTDPDSGLHVNDVVKANNKNLAISGWILKDGTILIVKKIDNPVDLEGKGIYKGPIAEVFVDIDGDKRAGNKVGQDVFGFLLDRTGALIPAGSREHKFIEVNGETYLTDYSSSCNVKSEDLNENFACTGSIANNGWSISGLKYY